MLLSDMMKMYTRVRGGRGMGDSVASPPLEKTDKAFKMKGRLENVMFKLVTANVCSYIDK